MNGVTNPMPGVQYLPAQAHDYYVAEGLFTEETLGDALSSAAAFWPDRIALSEPGVTVTFREFEDVTNRVAAALFRLGLEPLDRVLIQAINSKEQLYAFFGCIKAGIIPVCTLAAHRGHEIEQIGRQSGAKAHIVSHSREGFDLVGFAINIRERLDNIVHVIAVQCDHVREGALAFEALWRAEDSIAARAAVAAVRASLDPRQVAIFQLSGGTSGTPKIIPRFHDEYLYAARAINQYFSFDETVVSFTPNPMMHNMPMLCFVLPALLRGAEVAIAPSPRIETIGNVIAERRPRWCAIFPAHIVRLKELGLIDASSFSAAYGLVCMNEAAGFSKLVNAPAFTLYGMTEGLLCHTRASDPPAAIAGTIGRSICEYDEIRLVEPGTDREVEAGSTGELLVRGPSVIRGYYDAPGRNAEAFTDDGFYRSGDLMRWVILGGQRYLAFEGRVKDVIDRGGEKINCSEVELAIAAHPKVDAVLCVAMPDPVYGEKMCAFVVPTSACEVLELSELASHLGAMGLAKFKYPERLEIIDAFPTTSSGKPSKPLLRELIATKIEAERTGAVAA